MRESTAEPGGRTPRRGQQWGFLLLEGVWAIVSAFGLTTAAAARLRRVDSGTTRESGAPD